MTPFWLTPFSHGELNQHTGRPKWSCTWVGLTQIWGVPLAGGLPTAQAGWWIIPNLSQPNPDARPLGTPCINGEMTSASSMHGHLFWSSTPPDFIVLLSNVVVNTTMVRRLRRKRWIVLQHILYHQGTDMQTSHKISIGIHLPSSNNSLSEGALPWPPSSCTEPCRASRMTSDSFCTYHA